MAAPTSYADQATQRVANSDYDEFYHKYLQSLEFLNSKLAVELTTDVINTCAATVALGHFLHSDGSYTPDVAWICTPDGLPWTHWRDNIRPEIQPAEGVKRDQFSTWVTGLLLRSTLFSPLGFDVEDDEGFLSNHTYDEMLRFSKQIRLTTTSEYL